jgi:hypothetical protein
MLPPIPTDLLIFVRDYLLGFPTNEYSDFVQKFARQELERSWRNFLTVCREATWGYIRKETMIWSLNQVASRKYFLDLEFRKYINESVLDSAKQVSCRLWNETVSVSSPILYEVIATSKIGFISVDRYFMTTVPSLMNLHTLSLRYCSNVTELGSFPQLRSLQLYNCPGVGTIGQMNNLRDLYLEYVPGVLASQFPLEQIEKLIMDVTDIPLTILPRLRSIKDLSLAKSHSSSDVLTFSAPECFASLRRLQVHNFSTVNLSGLVGLKELSLMYVPSSQIFGKEEIYPQLRSYYYGAYTDHGEELDYYYSHLKNITDFTLHVNKNRSQFVLPEGSKIKSLNISKMDIPLNTAQENRLYWNLRLCSCDIQSYSMFSNVQKLVLIEPTGDMDIRPLRNIPYLHLEDLQAATDLSCLGNQRCLHIVRCHGLSNEAVKNFGNVFQLSIWDCNGVSEVVGLNNTGKLELHDCQQLKKVDLRGNDYISVYVLLCNDLDDFRASGRIYYLKFARGTPWRKSLFACNYEYLNGEKQT